MPRNKRARCCWKCRKVATKHMKSTLKRLARGQEPNIYLNIHLPSECDMRGVGKMKVALRKKESEYDLKKQNY